MRRYELFDNGGEAFVLIVEKDHDRNQELLNLIIRQGMEAMSKGIGKDYKDVCIKLTGIVEGLEK